MKKFIILLLLAAMPAFAKAEEAAEPSPSEKPDATAAEKTIRIQRPDILASI